MLREKPKLFTIGQFAALHGINKKTLMWYDEIGLFKPAFIHEENGYRLYSYYQSTELEVILLLRDMNVPIRDIQEFMKNRSAGSMTDLLRDKISELDRTIQGLKAVRSKLCSRRQEMTELLDLDLSEISLIEREPQYLATVQTSPEKSLEDEIELILEQTKKYQLPRMYQTPYGSMLPVENLLARRFEDYSRLFIELPDTQNRMGLHRRPGGVYLRAFCIGNWDRLPARYEAILRYAEQHHLQFSGYAYEIGINELVIDRIEDYITKIEIPVLNFN